MSDSQQKAVAALVADVSATTVEVPTNHVAMVSHPEDVVKLVKTAAESMAVPDKAVA